MAKIENIIVYPTITPAADDLLIGTDVSDNNKTVTFTVGSIGGGGGALQGLQSVLDTGNTATQNIILTGNIDALGGYLNTNTYQINGSTGTVGQVLTSGGPGQPSTWTTPSGGSSCCNIQNTLTAGDTTQLSFIMNGAGQQLSVSGGTDLNVGSGSDINMTGFSNLNLGDDSILTFSANATLQDGTGSTGSAGQILTVNAAGDGLEWVTGLPGGSTPTWQQTLQVGNTANNISVNLTTAPLTLDAASPINSAGANQFTGNNTFAFAGATSPAITILGNIMDAQGSVGVGKQVLMPDPSNPGTLTWQAADFEQDLQSVLNEGNQALGDIFLDGNIDLTYNSGNGELILGSDVAINANGSLGTPGQFLTATASGVEWTDYVPLDPNLQTVLDTGNTADQNITLTGATNNITAAIFSPTNINVTNGTGGPNQILQSNNGVLSWVANTASGMTNWVFEGDGVAPVQQTVTDGALVQFLGGTGITTTSSNTDQLTIDLDNTGVAAGTYASPSSVTVNAQGQLTAITGGTNPAYELGSQAAGANVELDLNEAGITVSTVTLVAGTNVTLSDNGTNQITIDAASASGMTNFYIVSDSGGGSKQSVTDGIDYLFEGGTYITTFQTGGTPNTLTINHDATTRSDTTSTSSPAFGGTLDVVTSVSTNATGHLTAINVDTVTLPSSAAVTNIATGAGLTGGPITNTGTIAASYSGANSIILDATDGTSSVSPGSNDQLLLNVNSTNQVYYVTLGQLTTAIGGGTVLSVDASIGGTAISVSGGPITTTGVLAFTFGGTSSQYIDGAGDLTTFPAITTYDLSVPSATTDIRLAGSDGTNDDITITGGTNVTVTRASANELVIAAAGGTGLSSFTLNSSLTVDTTNPEMTIAGGSVISAALSATNTVTLNHDVVSRTDTPTSTTPSIGDVIPFVTAVSSSAEGHVTGTDVKTITWPLSVTSVGLSYVTTGGSSVAGSAAFTVGSSPITGTGTISLTSTGTGAQYIDGEGKLADFPTIPTVPAYTLSTLQNGATVEIDLNADGTSVSQIDLVGGTNINVTKSLTNTITIDMAGTIGTVTNVSSSHAGTAFAVTVTNPTTTPDIDITMAGNASQYINGAGDLVTFPTIPTNTTYDLSVPTATTDIRLAGSDGTNDDITITGGANVTVTRVSATELSIAAAAGTGLSSFTLDGDSGPQQTVDAANPDMNILGGTVISSVASATNNITLNHDSVTRSDTTSSSTPAFGGTISFVNTITSSTEGHITAVDVETATLPSLSIGLAAPAAFTVTGSPITSGTGTLTFAGAGTVAQYIDGTGALQTFPTIDNTTYTYTSAQNGANVDLDLTSVPGGVVQEVKLVAGTGITLTDSGTNQITIDGNIGTVTSVGAAYSNSGGTGTAGAAAFTVGVTNPTSTPVITLTGDGTSAQYIDGTGSLATFPTIPTDTTYDLTVPSATTNIRLAGSDGTNDDITLTGGTNVTITRTSATELTIDASAGTGLSSFEFFGDQAGSTTETVDTTNNTIEFDSGAIMAVKSSSTNKLTISHASVTTTQNTLPGAAPAPGTSVNIVTGVTADGYGHVTDVDTTPVTWPASAPGTVQSVGLTMPTAFTVTGSPITSSGVLAVTASGTTAQYIDGTGALQTTPTQWSGWLAASDSGTTHTISASEILTFDGAVTVGGAGIYTLGAGGPKVEIGLVSNGGTPSNQTFYRGDGFWAVPPGTTYELSGGSTNQSNPNSFLQIEDQSSGATSVVKMVGTGGTTVSYNAGTSTMTIDSSTGSATNFNVQGSTGSTVNITQLDTLNITAGTGIQTVSTSATDTVQITNSGVTSLIAGAGISLSGSTGAVTVSTVAAKSTGIFITEDYNFCGKAWADRYNGSPTSWHGLTTRSPRGFNTGPNASCLNATSIFMDDYSWWTNNLNPSIGVQMVSGIEGGINTPIWASPYLSAGDWSGEIAAFSITFSASTINVVYGNLANIEIQIWRGNPCDGSTAFIELEKMGACKVNFLPNSTSRGNMRWAYCCEADVDTWTTGQKTLVGGNAIYLMLNFQDSTGNAAILNTNPTQPLQFFGQVRLHII